MMSLKQLLHAALGAALLSIVSAHADTLYTVTDLGSLGRDAGGSKAYAINERGQVTGVGAVPLPNPTNAGGHAFLYDRGSMMDLGSLWRDSFGQAINNRGEVAGFADVPQSGQGVYRAFLYSDGVMRDIGTLGGYGAQALGLNERGQVTGYSNLSQFSGQHAFLYSDGVMHDLGTPAGGSFSVGTGINNAGQVVGYSDAAPGGGFLFSDGTMKLLGTLGGTYTIAYAINQRGQVTGGSAANPTPDNPFGVMHPFLYTQGVMRDIGNGWVHLGWGTALNEHGSVVGVAIIGEGASAEPHAFVYSQGVTTDLNALLDPVTGAGWVIREATGVNDRGEIVGSATRIGDISTAYAVLLTPRR